MLDLTATDAQVRCRPMGDRVLVLPEEDRTMSAGGVHLPDTHNEREEPRRGRVLAVGAGKWNHGVREPMDLEAGMRVAFSRNAGNDITIGEVEFLLIHERDVFAVLDG